MADKVTASSFPHSAAGSRGPGQGRTARACDRCRRQKLKCDTEKPCALCKRARTNCEVSADHRWRTHFQSGHPRSKKRKQKQAQPEARPDTERVLCLPIPGPNEAERSAVGPLCADTAQRPFHESDEARSLAQSPQQTGDEYPDSSTLDLVKEAFSFHESGHLATAATSSLPGGKPRQATPDSIWGEKQPRDTREGGVHRNGDAAVSSDINRPNYLLRTAAQGAQRLRSRTVAALLDELPREQRAVDLLIDTYFDRVHWFMLTFHQDTFRQRFRALISRRDFLSANSNEDFSFACTVLTVAALGLQYTCPYRKQLLMQLNVDPETLLLRLLSTVQGVLFDIIAIGSLESVQVCVLIGSFHLFHGNPGPALPIIGCGLRIAQGMGLHRRAQHNSESCSRGQETDEAKRCWLALFEIDRFCSMVYGLPISFMNEDCDIARLVLTPSSTLPSTSWQNSAPCRNETLLFYKGHMSELSIILTDVLRELYTQGPRWREGNAEPASFLGSQIQILSSKINSLDHRLRIWYEGVHSVLHLEDYDSELRAYASPEAWAQNVGGSGDQFDRHILRMQAVTLKLAFENAIIMTHRPLLSFRSARVLQSDRSRPEVGREMYNPFSNSIQACCNAALSTAAIGSFSAFDEALDTYAASFIGIHVFTAGMVLCLIASYEPMMSQAHEAKAGIQKLMAMQRKLQNKSAIAAQGLEILEKVVSLVIERELQEVLGHVRSGGSKPRSHNAETPHAESQHPGSNSMHVSSMSGTCDLATKDGPPSLGGAKPVGGGNREAGARDLFPPQPQIGPHPDSYSDASANIVSDMNYIVEDYLPYLGGFSTDIEQGWIWDPDWVDRI